MLGFLTLLALVLALSLGGFWWAGFVVLFLAWLGKRSEAKGSQATESEVNPVATLSDNWPAELLDACLSLSGKL